MNNLNIYTIGVVGGIILLLGLVLLVLMAVVYKALKNLEGSFAKIGYVAREDTKHYFEESAEKALEVSRIAIDENKKQIEDTMKQALADSGNILRDTLAQAEKQAGEIILQAHRDADNIKKQATQDADKYFKLLIDQSAEAIDWALAQFVKEEMSVKDHEELIGKLVNSYLNDHRTI